MDLLQETLQLLRVFSLAVVDLLNDTEDVLRVLGDAEFVQLAQSLFLFRNVPEGICQLNQVLEGGGKELGSLFVLLSHC